MKTSPDLRIQQFKTKTKTIMSDSNNTIHRELSDMQLVAKLFGAPKTSAQTTRRRSNNVDSEQSLKEIVPQSDMAEPIRLRRAMKTNDINQGCIIAMLTVIIAVLVAIILIMALIIALLVSRSFPVGKSVTEASGSVAETTWSGIKSRFF